MQILSPPSYIRYSPDNDVRIVLIKYLNDICFEKLWQAIFYVLEQHTITLHFYDDVLTFMRSGVEFEHARMRVGGHKEYEFECKVVELLTELSVHEYKYEHFFPSYLNNILAQIVVIPDEEYDIIIDGVDPYDSIYKIYKSSLVDMSTRSDFADALEQRIRLNLQHRSEFLQREYAIQRMLRECLRTSDIKDVLGVDDPVNVPAIHVALGQMCDDMHKQEERFCLIRCLVQFNLSLPVPYDCIDE